MTVTAIARGSAHSTSNTTSYSTNSFAANIGTMLVAVVSSNNDTDSAGTVTQGTIGFTKVFGISRGVAARTDVWAAIVPDGPGFSSFPVTASGWATNRKGCHICVAELSGVRVDGLVTDVLISAGSATGTGATGGTVNLAPSAFATYPISRLAVLAAFEHNEAEGATIAQGTELDDGSYTVPTSAMVTNFVSAGTATLAGSWATVSNWMGVAVVILAAQVLSHTSDALVQKTGNLLAHTSDAILSGPNSYDSVSIGYDGTATLYDSPQLAFKLSHTSDAALVNRNTKSHTADAVLRQTFTLSQTSDAVLRQTKSLTHTSDAVIRKTTTPSHTSDAVLRQTFTVQHTSDSVLRKTQTLTHTSDGVIKNTTTLSHTSDARLTGSPTVLTHTSDAVIGAKLHHTSDAVLRQTFTLAHTSDSVLRKTQTPTHTSDAVLRKTTTKTHTSDAVLRQGSTLSHTSDAVLRKSTPITHTSDAVIRKATTKSHTSDALVVTRPIKSHTSDAVLSYDDRTLSHTSDAVIVVIPPPAGNTTNVPDFRYRAKVPETKFGAKSPSNKYRAVVEEPS